jgi:hypothetical protein
MMRKQKSTYVNDTPSTMRHYACRHWAEKHLAVEGEDLQFSAGRKNMRIMTDEQHERRLREGGLSEVDGRQGRGSLMVCQDCYDAKFLAGGDKGTSAYYAWKEDYAKRMGVNDEMVVPVVELLEELLEELVAA